MEDIKWEGTSTTKRRMKVAELPTTILVTMPDFLLSGKRILKIYWREIVTKHNSTCPWSSLLTARLTSNTWSPEDWWQTDQSGSQPATWPEVDTCRARGYCPHSCPYFPQPAWQSVSAAHWWIAHRSSSEFIMSKLEWKFWKILSLCYATMKHCNFIELVSLQRMSQLQSNVTTKLTSWWHAYTLEQFIIDKISHESSTCTTEVNLQTFAKLKCIHTGHPDNDLSNQFNFHISGSVKISV